MERLTIRNSKGIGVLKQPFQCEQCGDFQWSLPDLGNGSPIDRLAEYEDTGLLPEQIIEIDKLYAEKCSELAKIQKEYLSGLELAQIWASLNELKEYRRLDKQGKLLKLPCAVGDTVYKNNPLIKEPIEIIIESIFIHSSTIRISGRTTVRKYTVCIGPSDFGSTVFLTREEAEAALKNQNSMIKENQDDRRKEIN